MYSRICQDHIAEKRRNEGGKGNDDNRNITDNKRKAGGDKEPVQPNPTIP